MLKEQLPNWRKLKSKATLPLVAIPLTAITLSCSGGKMEESASPTREPNTPTPGLDISNSPVPTAEAVPTIVPQETIIKLTPEERISAYAQEALNPEFSQVALGSLTTLTEDRIVYSVVDNTVDGTRQIRQYSETEGGVPQRTRLGIIEIGGRNINRTTFFGALNDFFQNIPEGLEPTEYTLRNGSPVMQVNWTDSEGNREVRYTQRFNFTQSNGELGHGVVFGACRVHDSNLPANCGEE